MYCKSFQVLDALADPISAVLKKKCKENASPQDVERHNELQRAAMVLVRIFHLFRSAFLFVFRFCFAFR